MPSRLWQQSILVYGKKKGEEEWNPYVLITRKTGYMNVWINNTHFYYNHYDNADDIGTELEDTVEQAETASAKKGIIWIRRK